MRTICTKRHLVFHNPETGEQCSVPKSLEVQNAKRVPDWVLDTLMYKLASRSGDAFEVLVPEENLDAAKVVNLSSEETDGDKLLKEIAEEDSKRKSKASSK